MLIPPELMGTHIGPQRSLTTGRRHDLSFRAVTALFGHLGIEWNLLALDDAELAAVAEVIALHRRFRPLLHGGDAVRFDTEPAYSAHGVYAPDRSEALVSLAAMASAISLTPPPLLLPGLDPGGRYEVRPVPLPGERQGPGSIPAWMAADAVLAGDELAEIGLQPPPLHPETALLMHFLRH